MCVPRLSHDLSSRDQQDRQPSEPARARAIAFAKFFT